MTEFHGHKTMADGSRVPLTSAEVEAIWKAVETARAKRDAAMPRAKDALAAISSAHSRMNDLGWWLGGGFGVRRGDECAVAQSGSTGIWRGRLDADGKYVHFADSVSDPCKCWLKPISDLTAEELAWMDECDQREAEAYSAMMGRLAQTEAAS